MRSSVTFTNSTIRVSYHQKTSLVSVVALAMRASRGSGWPTAIAPWPSSRRVSLKCLGFAQGHSPQRSFFDGFGACSAGRVSTLLCELASRITRPTPKQPRGPPFCDRGKTARRSHDHQKVWGALHSVTVWSSGVGLSLGKARVAENRTKSRRFPSFCGGGHKARSLQSMRWGTRKRRQLEIVNGGADYVLAFKGNQGRCMSKSIELC